MIEKVNRNESVEATVSRITIFSLTAVLLNIRESDRVSKQKKQNMWYYIVV